MRTRLVFLALLLGVFSALGQKELQMEEIWDGTFQTKSLFRLHSLNNGEEYTVMQYDFNRNRTIDVYRYDTGEKVRRLLNAADHSELKSLFQYSFSPDESMLLLGTERQSIYRRSVLAVYYVLDIATGELHQVDFDKIQEPTFSADGSKIAYGKENNLFIKDLKTQITTQVTTDGKRNEIINGIADWVYEEEFAIVRMFDWSADGKYLAYIRFDEREVPEFSMDVYGKALYPTQQVFKYPKAGEKNSEVSLHIYSLEDKIAKAVDFSGLETDYYIPRLKWTKDAHALAVQLTNRHQNILDLVYVHPETASYTKVLHETDDAYIDVTDDWTFMEDGSFFWTSERDGWNHLYHYDKNGKLLHQVTKGDWDVTRFYGLDAKKNMLYYQSTENGSLFRDVYSIKTNGKSKKQLVANKGTNSASFSADMSLFINTHTSSKSPATYTLHQSDNGKLLRTILDNKEVLEMLENYNLPEKEYGTINISGYDLNMYTFKPVDFNPNKQYPVLLYQYSGPGSQTVSESWLGANDYWHQLLTQHGYIVVAVDGRGTGYKGSEFKKLTQKELGKYEVIDQIRVAEKLGKESYIDASRIGIWGWSYGGFMSANAIFQAPDVFSTAIAVAPVTSWRFYDTIYTERYMQTPQENPSGYDQNSPLTHAENLKGNLLLVHGTSDDNVHVDNTMKLIDVLVRANKDFDWLIYPDRDHGIYGGNTRLHLYNKMTEYILKNL
ncbi:MAG TPA: S9 family peptidase [Flavobacteriaceae bacterium]|nr:S9 family peptidase [Flavobacteriaceae bacterium]